MFILGLTGSIGMGKSAAAKQFQLLGVPVHDSDKAVHQVMAPNGPAVLAVSMAFPSVVRDNKIDRQALGQIVFSDKVALRRLEKIVHPLVRQSEQSFLGHHARSRTSAVVLDVPLLFETGGERRCDAVAVVSAPFREQRRRVLSRSGMDPDRFAHVLTHQMSDLIKRKRADFVIHTGLGFAYSLRIVREIVTIMRKTPGTHWPLKTRPRVNTHA